MKPFFKDVRIVGAGEATHGTGDFFKFKHRLIQFFVKEMGFSFVAAEVPFSEALTVNEYVLHGKGDPAEALKGVYFWMWQTNETLALVQWMRNYNKNLPLEYRIRFYGIDMAISKGAVRSIKVFLEKVDPNTLCLYSTTLDVLENENNFDFIQLPKIQKEEIYEQIQELKMTLDSKREIYENTRSAKEVALFFQHVHVLQQYLFNQNHGDSHLKLSRDHYMAENVKWLLDYEGKGSRGVLWAHNGHIEKDKLRSGLPSMGYYLRKKFGRQYYAVGMDFNEGGFLAVNKGLESFSVEMARKNSSGHLFSKLKSPNFFFDFTQAKDDSNMNKFLNKNIRMRDIPATFEPRKEKVFYVKKPLNHRFDGLVFIDSTTRATPLPVEKPPFVNISKSVNAKRHQGKTFALQAEIAVAEKAKGDLWIHITDKHNVPVFRKLVPIGESKGKVYQLEGVVDAKAMLIAYGFTAKGTGKISINQVKLFLNEEEVASENSGFEMVDYEEGPQGWNTFCRSCVFRRIEPDDYGFFHIELSD